MTTIAYRDRILVSDSAIFADGYRVANNAIKIVRCKDGSLLGASGDMVTLTLVRDWIDGGMSGRNPVNENSTALHVKRDGSIWIYESHGAFKINRPYYATGSGGLIARVAMECGKSAVEAVAMAIKFDPWSGGRVRKLEL